MQKLHLKTSSVIQGDFEFEDINLLLVFQVNCPGCFAHAFPLANEVFENYQHRGINVLGLSTAFEDFEYNNKKNTELLFKKGQLVGETKKFFEKHKIYKLPYSIDFPIALDLSGGSQELYTVDDARNICELHSYFQSWDKNEQNNAVDKVYNNLKGLEASSYTFTTNQLMGTPSWILFQKDMGIINKSFGHRDKESFFSELNKVIESTI